VGPRIADGEPAGPAPEAERHRSASPSAVYGVSHPARAARAMAAVEEYLVRSDQANPALHPAVRARRPA